MKPFFKLVSAALVLSLPMAAQAHRVWILPNVTVWSGSAPVVSFDAAVSNDIFVADHSAYRLDSVKIKAPDGQESVPQNAVALKQRSVFDVALTQTGTWKVYSASHGLSASWEEGGKRKFWPPRGVAPTMESFEKDVPKKADNLQIAQTSRRYETFVTAGKPSDSVLKPSNIGLELVPVTHPNNLVANEVAVVQFLIDGKPAVGAKIEVIAGGRRYRNSEDAQEYRTDKDGKASIAWPGAGQYFLEAEYEDAQAPKPASKRVGRYAAVLEVLPQ